MNAVRASLFVGNRGAAGELDAKVAVLHAHLAAMGRTLVAYSGGVDSSVLLAEASRILGDRAVGVIARSPSLPAAELTKALRAAAEAGLSVRVVETHELDRAAYRANTGDRCFHCKTELFLALAALAEAEGFDALAYGAVTDDLGDVRPGMAAATAFRVRAPLLEAGLSKLEVRVLARRQSLPMWDKPQSACLASRIPVGTEVTEARLRQVEGAEGWIHDTFKIRVLRVRHEGRVARIEVAPEELSIVSGDTALLILQQGLQLFGFSEVIVDPRGYCRPDPIPDLSLEEERHGDR